jgi:hypothetical protein
MPSHSYANAVSGCLQAGAVQACLHGRLRGGSLALRGCKPLTRHLADHALPHDQQGSGVVSTSTRHPWTWVTRTFSRNTRGVGTPPLRSTGYDAPRLPGYPTAMRCTTKGAMVGGRAPRDSLAVWLVARSCAVWTGSAGWGGLKPQRLPG